MKKILLIGLALLVLGSGLFADDAKVMPGRVGRFYLAPVFAFAPGEYNDNGNYVNYATGNVSVFNLGLALEYGIIDWITAAVQWAPGWTYTSSLIGKTGLPLSNMNGVADLLVGAKIQIIGENAPVKTSAVRFALTPGVSIPLPGPDYEKQAENYFDTYTYLMSGGMMGSLEKTTMANMDRHVLGVGGRVYFDWVLSDKFFINLYNETFIYPVKKDLANDGIGLSLLKAQAWSYVPPGMEAMAKPFIDAIEGDINYKYKLTFEIEPVFTTPLSDGLSITAGLPITYVFNPVHDVTIKGINDPMILGMLGMTEEQVRDTYLAPLGLVDSKASHSLSVKPYVSFFATKIALPIEVKLQYGIPVWGMNTPSQYQFIGQIKAYFKI